MTGYIQSSSRGSSGLFEKGLIVQGSHPVDGVHVTQNPVSQHDTIGDVEPDFNEYTIIKFKSGGGGR